MLWLFLYGFEYLSEDHPATVFYKLDDYYHKEEELFTPASTRLLCARITQLK
jgi:dTDP-4-dehydrorhamnose 3,5-epimerase-like enzyme